MDVKTFTRITRCAERSGVSGTKFKRLDTVLRNYRLDTPGVTSFSLSSLQPGNPPLIIVIAFLGPGHLRQAMVNRLRRRRQVRTTFSLRLFRKERGIRT